MIREKDQSSLKKNTNKGILTLFNVKIFYKKCLISLRKLFSVYLTMLIKTVINIRAEMW